MKTIGELMDAIKERQKLATDSALAAALGVSRQTVNNWRQGRNTPDAVACATIAGLTGEPLALVLGIAGEQRAISREEKAVWRRLAATAAIALYVMGFAGNTVSASVSAYAQGPMPTMSSLRYWWRLALLIVGQRRKPAGPYIEARL